MIISLRIVLGMRNISDENCTENQNTHFEFSKLFRENRAVYEIMCGKYVTAGQPIDGNVIPRMRLASWVTKFINTHSEYVIFILFFHVENCYSNALQYYAFTYIAYLVSDHEWYQIFSLHKLVLRVLRGSQGRDLEYCRLVGCDYIWRD